MSSLEAAPCGQGPDVGMGGRGDAELTEDAAGCVGQEWGEEDGKDAAGLDEVVEDLVEARGLGGVLGELEGLGLLDVEVGAADEVPDGDQGALQVVLPEELAGVLHGARGVGRELVGGCRDDAVAVLVEHVDGAVEEVAEAVGELGVVAGLEALVGPVAVGADGELAQDVVAEGVEAPVADDGDGIDDVAGGLGEFLPVLLPPAVGEDLEGEREAGRVQHDGPIDGVEFDDVLADDVDVGGPEGEGRLGHGGGRGGEAEGMEDGGVAMVSGDGDVVGEGVEPDVGDPVRGEGQRDAP